jgi:hypothetical protein
MQKEATMSTLSVAEPHAQLAVSGTDVNSWKVTLKRGTQSGIGVSISGAGAWAKLSGSMKFEIRSLEDSKTYDEMKQSYDIGGGVSAFWSWLGISANASTHKDEIHSVFQEVQNTQKVDGSADFDMEVSGLYPNVAVDASAYVLVMEVEDSSGNTFTMMSAGDPSSDTGAQDGSGNALPTKGNNSSISL